MGRRKKDAVVAPPVDNKPKINRLEESAKKKGFKSYQDLLVYSWMWVSRKDVQSQCKDKIRTSNGSNIKDLSKGIYKIGLDATALSATKNDDMVTLFKNTDWITITNKMKEQMALGE